MGKKLSRNVKRLSAKKLLVAAVLGVVILLSILELTGTTHLLREPKATPGIIPTANSSGNSSSEDKSIATPSTESTTPNTTPVDDSKQTGTSTASPTGAAPITPYGNFVSNHHPNLDGDPAPSSVQSVCNTTPGASCYIELTNEEGIVKTLASQKTDSNGATYWNWDVKQAGFTVGPWQIKAIATLNGHTRTATDIQNLEVGP